MSRAQMDELAERVDTAAAVESGVATVGSQTVDDLATEMRRAVEVGELSPGTAGLLLGDSAAARTLAAAVLARHLGVDLYRIDLSAVVSKYIGETEKNLRRVFAAAEETGALLFFDEADALFGKRSNVRDSHDKYANIEVDWLLKAIEAYSGLAMLASNRSETLDPNLVRRMRFALRVSSPGDPTD
jgi:SpoVK/Ycf46/Vps4 family AAA+-type ATPase